MVSVIEAPWRLFRHRLRDRRFLMVQALVIVISVGHTVVEGMHLFHTSPDLFLLPISSYFIPVVYAGLNFGLEGALPTAVWCALLSIPNLYFFHHGVERIGVAVQLVILLLVGSVVALRVDRERRAKLEAEAANRHLSEIRSSLEGYVGMALRAQEEERRRLARELHDEAIHDLLVIKTAVEDVPRSSDQRSQLAGINDALQRSIEGMRRFSRALRPSILDDLGLAPALESLLSDLGGRNAISTTLDVDDKRVRLDTDSELAIFRIAQEALHNVERHAHADHVWVSLTSGRDQLRLEIIDDGRGFNPKQIQEPGLGLVGMQERARLIGGSLHISSRPGATAVVLDLPADHQPDLENTATSR